MMYPSISDAKLTIGEVLDRLRRVYQPSNRELFSALQTSSATYLKIERGERELSLLMALRLCKFYKLDLHEFISMLSDEELGRQDYSVIRAQRQRERKRAEAAKAKVVDIKSKEMISDVRF